MNRVFNFNPGPSTLPLSVLEEAQQELLDFQGTGMSIAEHSHRGPVYSKVHDETKALIKDLLAVPDNFRILFMQGGASGQFALLPMNLISADRSADYILTGSWSKKALAEAKQVGAVRVAADTSVDGAFLRVPNQDELNLDSNARYVHLTSNNTIAGTQFQTFPDTGSVPIAADMSSDILGRPLDFSKFGVVYAGTQKNLGPAGLALVIIRDDLIDDCVHLPKIFRYKTIADNDSLQNTVPTFNVYLTGLVLKWIRDNGGALGMQKRNQEKADVLYGAVDARPEFFRCPVERASRSVMNVVFRLPSEELEKTFIAQATDAGLVGLKGHRSVGGIRASIYNSMELAGVQALVDFMDAFAKKHG